MIEVSDLNLENAETTYMVANTPMFIVRKLKADPVVLDIAKRFKPEEIADQIRIELNVKPENVRQRALAFVLLVALSLKQDRRLLREVSNLDCSNYRWFDLVVGALIEIAKATTKFTVNSPVTVLPSNNFESANSSSTTTSICRVAM